MGDTDAWSARERSAAAEGAERRACSDAVDEVEERLAAQRGGGEGLQTELAEIERLWESRGVFALHADITSCIRHGDVIAFERLDPPEVFITESKASGSFNPDSKQGKRLLRLVKLLNVGAHPEGADGDADAAPLKLSVAAIAHG